MSIENPQDNKHVWTIRDCLPVMAEIVGIRRAWYHFRSGGFEWKEQSPSLFASESQAVWACIKQELAHAVIESWGDGSNRRTPFESVNTDILAERVYERCCQYHRATVKEITQAAREAEGST